MITFVWKGGPNDGLEDVAPDDIHGIYLTEYHDGAVIEYYVPVETDEEEHTGKVYAWWNSKQEVLPEEEEK